MPSLIVFDLDLTLWHCGPLLWCDQLMPPLKLSEEKQVLDADGVKVSLFHEVPDLLNELADTGIPMAVASRTSAPKIARQLLELFKIAHHFEHQEIYPGDKTAHFAALQKATGLPYSEMTFFDDELRNIEDVSSLGVQCHLVTIGISRQMLRNLAH
ncbi:MAG: magnesium-dependent phosphatase-1 [Roseibacillus sp.]